MKLVVELAKSPQIKISLRAVKSLGYALKEPMAMLGRKINEHEISEWIPFQLSVLDGIEDVLLIQKHPLIYVDLKSEIAWHVQHSKSEVIKKEPERYLTVCQNHLK